MDHQKIARMCQDWGGFFHVNHKMNLLKNIYVMISVHVEKHQVIVNMHFR